MLIGWRGGKVEWWNFFLFAWDEKLEDKKCRMYKFTHVTSKEYLNIYIYIYIYMYVCIYILLGKKYPQSWGKKNKAKCVT